MSWKRKQVITHSGVQVRLAMVFVFWAVILMISLTTLFFINYASISAETGGMVIHDQLLTKMLLISQAKELGIYYGGTMLIFIILIGAYVFVYSHRIVGPIHKMNLLLDKAIKNKEWPKPVGFRKNDAFHEFAHKFNEFVETMKKH
jgi:methyl-accepting chemotaxis protein